MEHHFQPIRCEITGSDIEKLPVGWVFLATVLDYRAAELSETSPGGAGDSSSPSVFLLNSPIDRDGQR
jgi:hypothetical protein